MKPLCSFMISHSRSFRRLLGSCVVAWLIVGLLPGAASGRIRRPSVEELVESADLIITGQVDSVRMTSCGLVRRISLAVMAVLAPLLTVVAWWKRGNAVACVVALSLVIVLGFLLGPRPTSNYHKVARVFVSRTIKGLASPGTIRIFYDRHEHGDKTHFALKQNYLLFLRRTSLGYTTSWGDWGVWTIAEGYAQTVRRERANDPPIKLTRLISKVELFRDRDIGQGKADVDHWNVCIDLSPDGRSVVFSSACGDLFLFDLSARTISRLTSTRRVESYPSFSPDGKYVVFAASENGSSASSICKLSIATLDTARLTDGEQQRDFYPRFTPDGERIVFARAHLLRPRSYGGWTWDNWDIYQMGADGSRESRLTDEKYCQLGRIVPRSGRSMIFAAAPRGARIDLFSLEPPQGPTPLLPRLNAGLANEHADFTDPTVSPAEDSSIGFVSDCRNFLWDDICVVTRKDEPAWLVGGQPTWLGGEVPRYIRYPDFFPDGQRLLFMLGFDKALRPIYSLWEVSLAGQTREIASSNLFSYPELWQSKAKGQ